MIRAVPLNHEARTELEAAMAVQRGPVVLLVAGPTTALPVNSSR